MTYIVMNVDTGVESYVGGNAREAATFLKPRTVCGRGHTVAEARQRAKDIRTSVQKGSG